MAIAVSLNNVVNLQDTTTAQTTINTNSSVITTALQDGLSRSGQTPNTMGSSLDMNSNRILNLSAPGSPTEPIRVADFTATPNTTLTFASPSALVGLTPISGSASTTIHSDGAPALNQAINPTWTGTHTFNNPVTIAGSQAVTRTSTDTLTNKTLTSPAVNGPTIIGGSAMLSGQLGWQTGAGAGGAVTQLTSKTTAVTINTQTGQITTNNSLLANNAATNFQVNNSQVGATDIIVVNLASGNASNNAYIISVPKVSAGSFVIQILNQSAGSLSEALVINFAVIQGTIT